MEILFSGDLSVRKSRSCEQFCVVPCRRRSLCTWHLHKDSELLRTEKLNYPFVWEVKPLEGRIWHSMCLKLNYLFYQSICASCSAQQTQVWSPGWNHDMNMISDLSFWKVRKSTTVTLFLCFSLWMSRSWRNQLTSKMPTGCYQGL